MNKAFTWINGVLVGFIVDGQPVEITDEIRERYATPDVEMSSEQHFPIPGDEWPIWANAFKSLSTGSDSGVGDTVARLIGEENSEKFKAWHKSTFGKDCNCTGRQKRWNKLYPLNQ